MTRQPPEGLSSPRALALWKSETKRCTRSAGRKALLAECCRALDSAEAFRQLRASQELVTTSNRTATPHLTPLWRAEVEALTLFTRLAKLLGLEWDASVDEADEADEAPRYTWTPPPWQRGFPERERAGGE